MQSYIELKDVKKYYHMGEVEINSVSTNESPTSVERIGWQP